MYLADANIWIEGLLEQERAPETADFFRKAGSSQLAITDFALFSIALLLSRLKRNDVLDSFIADVILGNRVMVLRLNPTHLRLVLPIMRSLGLDFDDAYHYLAAQEFGCTILSYDAHFDKTPLGRKAPGDII